MTVGSGSALAGVAWLREYHDYIAVAGMALFYGLGDTVTTLLIFADPTLVELNGFVRWIGPWWFVLAKAALVVFGYSLATRVRGMRAAVDYRWVTTLYCGSLAVRGVHLTLNNAALLL